MTVTWIASYPRSGNTWVRFLLVTYLHGQVTESAQIDRMIPNIHRSSTNRLEASPTRLWKTHFPWSDQHPGSDATSGFIYILRSPKDVLLSNLHYFRMIDFPVGDSLEFALDFIENGGASAWERTGLGTWMSHVESWLWAPTHRHLVLRYEEMVQEPSEALARILSFLGIEVSSPKVESAVRSCTLPNLRQLEGREKRARIASIFFGEQEGFRRGLRFFRRGSTGQSLSEIGEGLDEYFDGRFASFLHELEERIRRR